MLTMILSVLTLVSGVASGVSYFYARHAVAAQKQTRIIADQLTARINEHVQRIEDHTQQAVQWIQQAQSHQEQTKIIAGQVAERIDDHTQRVTEWIQQVQSPPSPQEQVGDPWGKGRAEIAKRAEDPEFLARVEEVRRHKEQNSGLIPPDSDAQSNPAAWRAKLKQKEQKQKEEVREIAKEILSTPGVIL
jgi:hypothetical protein